MISIIGENMNIRRFEKVTAENGFVASYIHGGGRIGILVEVETSAVNDEVKEAAKNVAMQIAAMHQKYVKRKMFRTTLSNMKSIIKAQIQNDPANAKKPENIIEKMIDGRLNKELKNSACLTGICKDGHDRRRLS